MSQIEIHREEPSSIDEKRVIERTLNMAEDIVKESWLKDKKSKGSVMRVRRAYEFDARSKFAIPFLTKWNKWRDFYCNAKPLHIKTNGQLTCIEKIIQMTDEREINLDILIAATHRAYMNGRYNPGFSAVLSNGIEFYEKHHDNVLADIDRLESGKRYG